MEAQKILGNKSDTEMREEKWVSFELKTFSCFTILRFSKYRHIDFRIELTRAIKIEDEKKGRMKGQGMQKT